VNEERTGKCLQVEHIRGHLRYIYSNAVNQIMVGPYNFGNDDFCNIPAVLAYELYISQMIRYSRACGSNHDVLDIGLLLTRQLLNQVIVFEFFNYNFLDLILLKRKTKQTTIFKILQLQLKIK
jgi:hypothetical protein